MSIRKRIYLYFSISVSILAAVVFGMIYFTFSEYREEEFQQREKQKISNTLRFLSEFRQVDDELIAAMGRLNINDLYDEKLLIFDSNKRLIYSSIDDQKIVYTEEILARLTPEQDWIETREGKYDVIATYVESNGQSYYGLCKAFDTTGFRKLRFLSYILLGGYLLILILVWSVALFIARRLSASVRGLTGQINGFRFDDNYKPLTPAGTEKEIRILTERFNELMQKMQEAFAFQKHAVHHISHELKTPVSILALNLERMERELVDEQIRSEIRARREEAHTLAQMIGTLLEIARSESGYSLRKQPLRIDELFFDVAEELKSLHEFLHVSVDYDPELLENDTWLTLQVNQELIKSVFSNLLRNAFHYGNGAPVEVYFGRSGNELLLMFSNSGPVLREEERTFLFRYFFRGTNSTGKSGFGLGLVFVKRILDLHQATISYSSEENRNAFLIRFPLS